MDNGKIDFKWALGLLILCFIEGILIFSTKDAMEKKIMNLQQDITTLQLNLDDGLEAIRGDLERNIEMQSKLYSDFSYQIEGGKGGQIHLTLNAVLKSIPADGTATFLVSRDSKAAEPIKTVINNNSISGDIILPMSEVIDVSLLIGSKTQSQVENLQKITDVSSFLSDHLYLTTDLNIKPKGDDISLSGGYVILNSKPNQKLDSAYVELSFNGKPLHKFYFLENQSSQPKSVKQQVFNLTFSDLIVDNLPGDYEFNITATEGDLEYKCRSKTFSIEKNGLLKENYPNSKFKVKLISKN